MEGEDESFGFSYVPRTLKLYFLLFISNAQAHLKLCPRLLIEGTYHEEYMVSVSSHLKKKNKS